MTIAANSRRREYQGNGVTTTFSGPMAYSERDIQVFLVADGVAREVDSGEYFIDRFGRESGTRVIMDVAPPAGTTLLLLRTVPYEQQVDITNQGAFLPETIERGYDGIVMQTQQLADGLSRTVRLSDTFAGDAPDLVLPSSDPTALIGWDQSGLGLVNYPASTLVSAATAGVPYTVNVSQGQTFVPLVGLKSPWMPQGVFYNGIFQEPGAYEVLPGGVRFNEPLPAPGRIVTVAVFGSPTQITESDALTFKAPALNSVTRSVLDKLADTVSVKDFGAVGDGSADDTAAITKAVAYAASIGARLDWPAGTYLTSASIPLFHSIQHSGAGAVVRGGNTYHIRPQRGQTTNLYVDPAGSDANDGLDSSSALATVQAAFDIVSRIIPEGINGNWFVRLAAGTYTNGATLSFVRPNHTRIRIIGPTVATNAVPTAIIDGASATTADGLFFGGCGDISVENVKIQGFTSNSAAAGIEASMTNLLRLVNVHVSNCWIGYYIRTNSTYFVQGGRIDNCTRGVQELFGVIRSTNSAATLDDGLQITNCTYGLFAKEHCTGHLDWTTIDNCDYGIFFSRSCTANASDCKITNCDYGVVLRHGSFIVPLRIDFGIGTGNANTANYLPDHSSGFTTNENDVKAQFSAQGERMVAYSAGVAVHTGTTEETRLAGLRKIIGGAFDYPGRYVRLVILGTKGGSAGTATLLMDVGGSNAAGVTLPASTGVFRVELWMISDGQGVQKVLGFSDGAGSNNNVSRGTRSYAMTTDTSIGLDCTLADAGDSITIDAAWLYTTGPVLTDGI